MLYISCLSWHFSSCGIGLPPAWRWKTYAQLSLPPATGYSGVSWRIFRWGRDIEAGTHDVTAIEAKVRWYRNRLSVSMNGKTYSLGGLLDEDLAVIARELRRALPNADKP